MEQVETLKHQVGGDHYMKMVMQPIELIMQAQLSYIQGNIVKYISRYKYKNGLEDIKKTIQYAKFAMEYDDKGPKHASVNLAYAYCKANSLSQAQTNIIISAITTDFYLTIKYCKQLAKEEYDVRIKDF